MCVWVFMKKACVQDLVYTGEFNWVMEHTDVMYSGERVHTRVLSMKDKDLSQPTDSLAKAFMEFVLECLRHIGQKSVDQPIPFCLQYMTLFLPSYAAEGLKLLPTGFLSKAAKLQATTWIHQ